MNNINNCSEGHMKDRLDQYEYMFVKSDIIGFAIPS